jgi:hypothetical protein
MFDDYYKIKIMLHYKNFYSFFKIKKLRLKNAFISLYSKEDLKNYFILLKFEKRQKSDFLPLFTFRFRCQLEISLLLPM